MISMIRYNRMMDKLHVTAQMQQDLLDAAPRYAVKKRRQAWKIAGSAAACLAVVLCLTTFLQNQNAVPPVIEGGEPPALGQSGVVDYTSIEALADSLDFALSVPETLPEGYAFDSAANQFGMAVVIYTDGAHQIKYYMSQDNAAVSGFYETAPETSISDKNAVLFGEKDAYTAVQWQDKQYSYFMTSDASFDEAQWCAILDSVQPVQTK